MARGLMQITEKTGNWGAEELKLDSYSSEQLFDPETNISIGCWYLSVLFNEFKNTDLVLAAYNGGSGNVNQWLRDGRLRSSSTGLNGIPYKETEKYVKKVNNSYRIYKRLYENKF
jgi:soluble lytic murein transglycosylase